MAYGTKYRFIFDSLAGTSFRIDIQKDGYSGSIIQRALGQAPHLRRDSAQNGICGTSLEIYAECSTDGEFAELYTTNARGYKALLQMYLSGSWSTIWAGFVSPELYSEPEIAPPYDVCITAVDGLGELKMYDFPANGRQSLRTHLQTILAYTGLDTYATDIISVSSLRGTSPTIPAATMLANTYVNLDHLSDGNCYEALQAIMQTLHMTITRYNNKWLLIRDSDVAVSGGAIAARNASGTSVSLPVAQYTSMTLGNWWPVGQMETEIVPAKKQVIVGYPYRVAESLFTNPETANPYCGVQPPPINVDDCPGWSSIGVVKSYDAGSAFYGNHALIGKLQQTIAVESQGSFSAPDQMQLVLKLAGIGLVSGPNSAKIRVKVFMSTNSSTGPWLKKKKYGDGETDVEWVTTDSYFELTVPVGYYSGPPDLSYTEFPIILPYVPGGNLTIQLDGSEAGNNIRFSVGGAYLTKPTINGYQDVINIDNSARDSEEDIELSFGDSPYTANALASVLNIMSDGSDNLTTEWATAQFTGEFLSVIAMDYALGVALPRLKARGTINVPRDSVVPAAFLNPDGIPMLFDTWDWNLFDDEVDVNMTSIPAAEVTIDTETITQLTDEQAAAYTGGTGGGSGGSGGYPAPTPGQNFFVAVEEDAETVGAHALYDIYIEQDPEEEEPELKNTSEILRHLRLETVTDALGNESTVLVTDITFASEKNTVAGWIGSGGGGGTVTGSLATLADVTLGTLSDGDILRYDTLTSHWVNTPLALSLGDLTNVELGTPSNGQALVYDSTAGEWKPGNVSGGGVTVVSSDATIGTSLTTLGTIDGTAIKAKIASYLLASNFTAANIVSTLGATAVNRATGDADGNTIKNYYAAGMNVVTSGGSKILRIINANGTTLNSVDGSDLVDIIGNTPVNRATADKNGNDITTTYLTSSAISDMATKTWVGQQGFLTSSSISDMATKTWVGQQGFLTSTDLSGYMLAADYTGSGTSAVNRAVGDGDGNNIKATYAAGFEKASDGHSGYLLRITNKNAQTISYVEGTDLVAVIGANAVARATADGDGNTIKTSYLRKDIDDTMSANLTIGANGSTKTLMVYGSGTFSTTLNVGSDATIGGNVTIGAQTGTTTAKTLTIYGRNNSTTPALTIVGVVSSSSRYATSIWRDASALQIGSDVFVNGNFKASGYSNAGASASDRRLKNDIRSITLTEAADLLSVLNPVVFQWNQNAELLSEGGLKGVSRGFIADEFLDLLPNAGRKMWGNYDAICYEQVIPYLVAGWQQQNLRIRILEGEISALREDNELLRRRLREANVLQ